MRNRATGERVKIVVWDSIGNTLLGVRPWSSWDAPVRETLLRENPSAESIAVPLREILADYDVDLTWFNSADAPYAPFGQLTPTMKSPSPAPSTRSCAPSRTPISWSCTGAAAG